MLIQRDELRCFKVKNAQIIRILVTICLLLLLAMTPLFERAIFPNATLRRADMNPRVSASSECDGSKNDSYMAFFEADEYAWQLFLQINRQARDSAAGEPDPSKPDLNQYDSDKPVVWETWALASGGRSGPFRRSVPNTSEVYLDKGQPPLPWGTWKRSSLSFKHFEFFQSEDPTDMGASSMAPQAPSQAKREAATKSASSFGVVLNFMIADPSVAGLEQIGEEVRTNRCSYEFVVENELYNVEGIEKIVRKALAPRQPQPDFLSFPKGAREVKAKWRRIKEEDKPRYHWRSITINGEKQIWGLVGLHITTKDLTEWFWASFEHVDFEPFAELPSVDSTTRGVNAPKRAPSGVDGVRIETVASNSTSKWQYYRLRGTQVKFSDARKPTILANSQIEHGFQQTSSCITCHTRAAAGLRSNRLDLNQCQPNSLPTFLTVLDDHGIVNEGIRYGAIGAPDPNWFRTDGARLRYLQTDFVWSIPFRALSTHEVPPVKEGDIATCTP
jgi:hypothetical protein